LVPILRNYFKRLVPEEENIDILADDWAIEIKTINTNYTHPLVKYKSVPITENVDSVLNDIDKLKEKTRFKNKAVLFIVFPLPEKSMHIWQQIHLNKIKSRLREIVSHKFRFRNGVPGIMYIGQV